MVSYIVFGIFLLQQNGRNTKFFTIYTLNLLSIYSTYLKNTFYFCKCFVFIYLRKIFKFASIRKSLVFLFKLNIFKPEYYIPYREQITT